MTFEHLALWGRATVLAPLRGGVRNCVHLIDLDGQPHVVRVGTRPASDLDWELDLLQTLAAAGVRVPTIVPTIDGRRHIDGTVVMGFLHGRAPSTCDDWRAVSDYLQRVHAIGRGHTQRPGWISSTELLATDRGPIVDLTLMAPDAVDRCRAAWRRLIGMEVAVVHGDPNDRNVRMTDDGVVLLDWDEARVDATALDFAGIPEEASPLRADERWAAEQALHAWEAAACWTVNPAYARRRLAQLDSVQNKKSVGTSPIPR